jgi:hypothetical protein
MDEPIFDAKQPFQLLVVLTTASAKDTRRNSLVILILISYLEPSLQCHGFFHQPQFFFSFFLQFDFLTSGFFDLAVERLFLQRKFEWVNICLVG